MMMEKIILITLVIQYTITNPEEEDDELDKKVST